MSCEQAPLKTHAGSFIEVPGPGGGEFLWSKNANLAVDKATKFHRIILGTGLARIGLHSSPHTSRSTPAVQEGVSMLCHTKGA
jgi:hypothetical protein